MKNFLLYPLVVNSSSVSTAYHTYLPHIPTHGGDSSGGGHRTRTLLCKKLDDGNLSVLLDLYYSIFNTAEFLLQADMTFRYCTLLHAYLGGVFLDDCFHLKRSVGCPLSYRNWNAHP